MYLYNTILALTVCMYVCPSRTQEELSPDETFTLLGPASTRTRPSVKQTDRHNQDPVVSFEPCDANIYRRLFLA